VRTKKEARLCLRLWNPKRTFSLHQHPGFDRCGPKMRFDQHIRNPRLFPFALEGCEHPISGLGESGCVLPCLHELGKQRMENLANPTLDKIRRVMSLVYKHGQRYGLIPRTEEANLMRFVRCKTTSAYEGMILTPKQAFDVLMHLQEP
jgi:hypothetical protein